MLSLVHALAAMTLAHSAVPAAPSFVPIRLPQGVQIELPRSWEVHARNQRLHLQDDLPYFDASLNQDFTANHYDAAGRLAASVHVGYYRTLDLTQADAVRADATEIASLDAFLRGSVVETSRSGGYAVTWHGTRRYGVNGVTAFVSEYSRSLLRQPDNFRVRLVRVFDGPRSFTLNVSYRESEAFRLRPLSDRIIGSLVTSSGRLNLFAQPYFGAAALQ